MTNPTMPRSAQPYKAAWPPPNRDYFTVKVVNSQALYNVSSVLWGVHEKDDLFVGPSVRLTSPVGRVQLETQDLAEQFCDHARDVLSKRHGEVQLEVVSGTAPTKISHRWTREQSERIRAMLDELKNATRR
ncbi:hypothetical protein JJQ59_34965 (plasmid) [Cupriavidus necator]|uniref:hypothetical protein n=1 Tax=Cupriavidus necator TaxID=106590 RepID=UPI0011BF9BA1|nr:hypothetical protein [Cupriavidus necator]QQX89728.1 hypothetical protein JJQ59_34965 [Cupriavidus necator]